MVDVKKLQGLQRKQVGILRMAIILLYYGGELKVTLKRKGLEMMWALIRCSFMPKSRFQGCENQLRQCFVKKKEKDKEKYIISYQEMYTEKYRSFISNPCEMLDMLPCQLMRASFSSIIIKFRGSKCLYWVRMSNTYLTPIPRSYPSDVSTWGKQKSP